MKKLILSFSGLSMMLLFTFSSCGPKTNEYIVKAKIGAATSPARAYMIYTANGERVIDSVDVVDNTFEFKGVTEEPIEVSLLVNYTPEVPIDIRKQRLADRLGMFIEPGRIIVTSADSIKNATIAESAINKEASAWNAKFAEIRKENQELTKWYYGLTNEERSSEATQERISEFYKRSGKLHTETATEYVEANPGSWFALNKAYPILIEGSQDVDYIQSVLDKFTPELRATKLGQQHQDQINAWKKTQIGAVAPDFTLNDPDGKPVSLSDFRGKYLLLDFWASWCGPCRAENPHVVAAFNKYKDKGFTILGVSLDGGDDLDKAKADWLKAIEADKLTWSHVSDLKGWGCEASKLYSVRGIPANFLLDPDGVIIEKDLRGDALVSALEKHIGGK